MVAVENDHVKIWIQDDILYSVYKNGALIGLEAAKENVNLRMSVSAGKAYNIICYYNKAQTFTAEARAYFASPEACLEMKKVAFIVNSVFSKYMGNAFISFNKPPVPVKLFTSEADAKKWFDE